MQFIVAIAYIAKTATGKKKRDVKNMYEVHSILIPKLSARIGFCSVSMAANIQLMTKNAAIMNTMH